MAPARLQLRLHRWASSSSSSGGSNCSPKRRSTSSCRCSTAPAACATSRASGRSSSPPTSRHADLRPCRDDARVPGRKSAPRSSSWGWTRRRAGFADLFARAVFAGWLIALMVWLLPAAGSARFLVIVTLVLARRRRRLRPRHRRIGRGHLRRHRRATELGRLPRGLPAARAGGEYRRRRRAGVDAQPRAGEGGVVGGGRMPRQEAAEIWRESSHGRWRRQVKECEYRKANIAQGVTCKFSSDVPNSHRNYSRGVDWMKIESQDRTVDALLKANTFVIPRFQRAYSWEADQINQFWNDVIDNLGGEPSSVPWSFIS